MREAFNEIGSAVPFSGLAAIGLVDLSIEAHRFPDREQPPLVVRETKLVSGSGGAVCRNALQVEIQRPRVLITGLGKGRVRKYRVQMVAVRAHSRTQRLHELHEGPS